MTTRELPANLSGGSIHGGPKTREEFTVGSHACAVIFERAGELDGDPLRRHNFGGGGGLIPPVTGFPP